MNWKVENKALFKTFELASFIACVDLLNEVTQLAEKLAHHPDVTIENYRFITFRLRTHDEDAVTAKDWELANAIDELLR